MQVTPDSPSIPMGVSLISTGVEDVPLAIDADNSVRTTAQGQPLPATEATFWGRSFVSPRPFSQIRPHWVNRLVLLAIFRGLEVAGEWVAAKLDDPDWWIIQSPFMREQAKTVAFRHDLSVADGTLFYSETTSLEIYGRSFDHTDDNQLNLKS